MLRNIQAEDDWKFVSYKKMCVMIYIGFLVLWPTVLLNARIFHEKKPHRLEVEKQCSVDKQ